MDDRTKMARSYLRGITTKAEFNSLLDVLFISDLEKEVVTMIYENGYDTEIIASKIGYSAPTVKAIHKRVLMKVSNFIYLTSSSK